MYSRKHFPGFVRPARPGVDENLTAAVEFSSQKKKTRRHSWRFFSGVWIRNFFLNPDQELRFRSGLRQNWKKQADYQTFSFFACKDNAVEFSFKNDSNWLILLSEWLYSIRNMFNIIRVRHGSRWIRNFVLDPQLLKCRIRSRNKAFRIHNTQLLVTCSLLGRGLADGRDEEGLHPDPGVVHLQPACVGLIML